MAKRIDITGQRFGRLVAIRDTGSHPKFRGRMWECQCDCGKTKIVLESHLTSGNTTSCGCKGRGSKKGEKRSRLDLTGQRFGNLVALRDVGKDQKNGGRLWECQCDCGNKTIVKASSLSAGDTRSCGCLLRGHARTQKASRETYSLCKIYQNDKKTNKTGARGVRQTPNGKYMAVMMYKGKYQYRGPYETVEEAALGYRGMKEEVIEENREWFEKHKKTCPVCGKEMNAGMRYCSLECKTKHEKEKEERRNRKSKNDMKKE